VLTVIVGDSGDDGAAPRVRWHSSSLNRKSDFRNRHRDRQRGSLRHVGWGNSIQSVGYGNRGRCRARRHVAAGSNRSTAKEALRELTALDAKRAALIEQLDLRIVPDRDR
jgi:hypothetical protein